MFIDRATGYFNASMDFKKDYAAILSALWDLDTAISDYLIDPNETSEFNLNGLGIHVHDLSPEEYAKLDEMYRKAEKAPKGWASKRYVMSNAVDRHV